MAYKNDIYGDINRMADPSKITDICISVKVYNFDKGINDLYVIKSLYAFENVLKNVNATTDDRVTIKGVIWLDNGSWIERVNDYDTCSSYWKINSNPSKSQIEKEIA